MWRLVMLFDMLPWLVFNGLKWPPDEPHAFKDIQLKSRLNKLALSNQFDYSVQHLYYIQRWQSHEHEDHALCLAAIR